MTQPPPYQPYQGSDAPSGQTLTCPKCRGTMRTYERNGIHLEQCDSCRGVFLDVGELEALTRLEANAYQAPPPQQYQQQAHGPGWGDYHGRPYRKKGFSGLFFSS